MGQYEGVDIVDVDLESFEDKPWRKPGADLTDYFNYGFNEQTWKAYCTKQKLFRDDLAQQKRNVAFPADLRPLMDRLIFSSK
jgi:pre-mRNA 3'-end-processing factor FIP1